MTQLPYVSLKTPLPTPNVTPAPSTVICHDHVDSGAMSVTTRHASGRARRRPIPRRRRAATAAPGAGSPSAGATGAPRATGHRVRPAVDAPYRGVRPPILPGRGRESAPARARPRPRPRPRPRRRPPGRLPGPAAASSGASAWCGWCWWSLCCSWSAAWSTCRSSTRVRYQAEARNESHQPITLNSLRGGIYARDGAPLALSVPTDDVIADDFQVAHPVKTAAALSPLLHIPAATLAPRAPPAFRLRRAGQADLAERRAEDRGRRHPRDHAGGRLEAGRDEWRISPSPVIGYHQRDQSRGAAGIEYADNRLLSGTAGKETLIESPSGCSAAGVECRGPHRPAGRVRGWS